METFLDGQAVAAPSATVASDALVTLNSGAQHEIMLPEDVPLPGGDSDEDL